MKTTEPEQRLSDRLLELLRCPRCKGELQIGAVEFRCLQPTCGETHPIVHGIPVLIDESRSVFRKTDFSSKPRPLRGSRNWKQTLRRALPELEVNSTGADVIARLKQRLKQTNPRPILLNVGGKHDGSLSALLADDQSIECIEIDLRFTPRTNLISDPCALPLAEQSVSIAVVDAFLEHVVDPAAVVAEIFRVLEPNGLVYADTPFMVQAHGGAHDFMRFSHLGHRRLFRDFTELESGVSCGPGSALALSIQYFLLSFSNSKAVRGLIQGVCRLLFFWLKYFDHYLAAKPGAIDAALGFFFVGRKSATPLPDRELVKGYRGSAADMF